MPFSAKVGQRDFRTMIGSCVLTAILASMMGNPFVRLSKQDLSKNKNDRRISTQVDHSQYARECRKQERDPMISQGGRELGTRPAIRGRLRAWDDVDHFFWGGRAGTKG